MQENRECKGTKMIKKVYIASLLTHTNKHIPFFPSNSSTDTQHSTLFKIQLSSNMIANTFRTIILIFLITTVTLLFYANSTEPVSLRAESIATSYVPPFSLHKRQPNLDTREPHQQQIQIQPQKETPLQQKDPFESIHTLDCKYGGIGFNGGCISPEIHPDSARDSAFSYVYPYPDLAPQQLNLSECVIDLNSVCSWRRNAIQTISKEECKTQLPPHMSSLNEFMSTLFSFYGPWSVNDKLILKYLLGNDSTPGPLRYYNAISSEKKGYAVPQNLPDADTNIYLTPQSFSPKPIQTARLAFMIMVHLDVQRLELLLDTIWHPRNLYVIHLDAKLEDYQVALAYKIVSKYSVGNSSNIEILPERFKGTWGEISLVYMNLAGIIKLLEMDRDSEPWSHVINLSVYDMNTKPIYRLSEFLSMDIHKHRNMLALEGGRPLRQNRQTEFYSPCGKVSVQVNLEDPSLCGGELCVMASKNYLEGNLEQTAVSNWMYRLPSDDMMYMEGSQWNFLTRDFALWLVSDFKAVEMLFSFKNTYIPDESYFQTALYNSPFRHTLMNNNFRWTDWKKNLRVDMDDVEKLKWGHHFFIRKVKDSNVAQAIIEQVYPSWSYTEDPQS
eukprot:TRINITY_DN5243_c0_g1_i1.p1 TRINITY_DN5243_c0_g1~~TRINITY_DN5243_c0_g1_i1.p1  ORF type:complete len:613 (+),score=96.88 TRINITY_DN5243_c0_g1_i1:37-1875(+)